MLEVIFWVLMWYLSGLVFNILGDWLAVKYLNGVSYTYGECIVYSLLGLILIIPFIYAIFSVICDTTFMKRKLFK